ncbi:MAG: SDR family oxidoreductase [Bacteroidia bacterium]|nr:SDR family oxidoreductase [Bacteroidia bacterium]
MSKTALITGASGGIGLELAKIHASKGGHLVLVARSIEKLSLIKEDLEKTHAIQVKVISKDLSSKDAALEVYQEIKKEKIQIDYLINNAGFGDFGFFYETQWNKEERMIGLNITSLTQFCKLFINDMISQGGGKIMNLASMAAFEPGPLMAVYYASKAYVLHFSEAINNELKDKNITVTALCPGPTESGFQEASSQKESKIVKGKKLPTAKVVAAYGYDAMLKGKAVAVPGFMNALLVRLVRFIPRSVLVKAIRKLQEKV